VIAVVAQTPLGAALAARLTADGREVLRCNAPVDGISACRLVLVDAAPSALRPLARALGDRLDGNQLIAHTVRGLGPDGAGGLAVLHDETPVRRLGVLGGPLGAADLEAGRPSAGVIASRHPEVVDEFARALSTPRLRIYRGRDPLGAELALGVGELVALGCGLVDGLGFGATTRAVMVVRAVRELGRLIGALGGDPATASGLGGLGDLMVRGADPSSDAFQYGRRLALEAGAAPPPALAELVETARTVGRVAARRRVEAHIFAGLAQLVDGQVGAPALVEQLMALPVLDD
jgi:glycerol-3-phosphate dehydrogenase (NAD(P)+)